MAETAGKREVDMFHRDKAINWEYESSVLWASCPVKFKFSVFLEKKVLAYSK